MTTRANQARSVMRRHRDDGPGRGRWLYPLTAALLVVLAAALYSFGIPPRRVTAITFLVSIVLCAVLWGRWPAIGAGLGSAILMDYFFVRPPTLFSVPSVRDRVVLFGLVTIGLIVDALSGRVPEIRQKVRAFAASAQAQKTLLYYGTGTAIVIVMTAAFRGFGAPTERLRTIVPYLLAIVVIAILWGRASATMAALTSVILIDYVFIGRPNDFSLPPIREGALFVGLIGTAVGVGTLVDQMREARKKARVLAESEHLQKTLLRVISHDLKTPLTTITGSLHTLLDKELNLQEDTRQTLVGIAYDQVNRLNRLVNGILEMTRMEIGVVTVRREPCLLADVVDDALGQLHEILRDRECRITFSASLPAVPGDPVLLSHVLANLLDNAAQFSPATSPIEIMGSASDAHVVVSIADRGTGILAAELDRVFEKFYGLRHSAAGAKTKQGAGLGLAIARGIVEAHGGRIWAERREGGGTIMRVRLPLT